MNWNEYKTLAIRTESVPPIALTTTEVQQLAWNNTNSIRMLHATMGTCTELAELLDGNGVVNFDKKWQLGLEKYNDDGYVTYNKHAVQS